MCVCLCVCVCVCVGEQGLKNVHHNDIISSEIVFWRCLLASFLHLRKSIILHGCVLGFHIAVPAEEELSSYHDNVKELAEAERMDNPSRHTVKTY